MAVELTQEQFDTLPESLQGEYKEVDGVYKNAAIMALKQSNNDLNSKYNDADIRFKEAEKNKIAEIETARAQALDEALEKARKENNIEDIERINQEKIADAIKRNTEQVKNETLTEFKKAQSVKDASNLAKEIASSLAVDDEAKEDLNDLIALRVKPDENGDIVFYNRDGSASTMNKEQFIAEINARHKRLVKAAPTTVGGGLANGNNGQGRSADNSKSNLDILYPSK